MKLLFVQKRFLNLPQIKESLEMVLAAASLDFNVSLLFVDDGVCQLACCKENDLTKFLTALPAYEVEKIYVAQESLIERKLAAHDLIFPIISLSQHEVAGLFRSHNTIFF